MTQQKQILHENNAVREVLQQIHTLSGYRMRTRKFINKKRYCICYGKDYHPNIAILFKREPFFNFGRKFRGKGMKGVGDSINVKALKKFVKEGVKIIYTKFEDGNLYAITLKDFLMNSYRWTQKEGTSVRSISIHEYHRADSKRKKDKDKDLRQYLWGAY